MQIALFYYTLIVLLLSVLVAAICLSAYLVSHRRTLLFAFLGFLFYFFDVALVFQDDFLIHQLLREQESLYYIGSPLASVLFGAGLIGSFWLLVCDFLNENRCFIKGTPLAVFVGASLVVLVAVPEGNIHEFLFYSMRSLFLCWILVFLAVKYFRSNNEVEKHRLWRHRWLFVVICVLGTSVVLENVYFLLVIDPEHAQRYFDLGSFAFLPERNFAENILVLTLGFFAARDAYRILLLRFEAPPINDGEPLQIAITQNIPLYRKRYQLSEREAEVLRLVLLGKDNQNIASSMNLALSTVKVHVHNILQKTDKPNRQELTRDFWKTS